VTDREIQASVLRRQHRRDRLLSWALAHLLEAREPRRTIRDLFCKVAEHFDFDAYLLYLFEPAETSLKLHAAGGISPETEQALSSLASGQALGTLFSNFDRAQACEHMDTTDSAVTELSALVLGFLLAEPARISAFGFSQGGPESASGWLEGAPGLPNSFDHQFLVLGLEVPGETAEQSAQNQAIGGLALERQEVDRA
jgi:hypothetical protein